MRRVLGRTVDRIRGRARTRRRVARLVREIQGSADEIFSPWLRSRLAELLTHARDTSHHYATRIPEGCRRHPLEALEDIPPLTKEVVRAHFDEIRKCDRLGAS